MKIGIDARMIGPATRGIGRYVERLISHLALTDRDNEYVIFTRPEAAHLVPAGMKRVITGIRWYGFAEQLKLGKIFDAEKLDLLHVPHWNAPLFMKTPLAITIHDMILWEQPSLESSTLSPPIYWAKYLFYRLVASSAAKRAKIIFTVSESAKNSILRNLDVAPEKIAVAPNGFDPLGAAGPEKRRAPYLLSVGSGYPHKNLATFFAAAKELFAEDSGLAAVVAGTDPAFLPRVRSLAERILGHDAGRVEFAGMVPDGTLAGLYADARAFIFTSLSEGFGLPVIEAAFYGTPIVASDLDTTREFMAGAFLPARPSEAADYAREYRRLMADPELKKSLTAAAFERTKNLSWDKTADLVRRGYENAFSTICR